MYHKHECPRCGAVWQHPDKCKYHEADHNCPACRTNNVVRYRGPVEPTYIWESRGIYRTVDCSESAGALPVGPLIALPDIALSSVGG